MRSGSEVKVAAQLKRKGIKYKYEQMVVKFTVPEVVRKYIPDFEIVTKTGKKIVIEVKGLWVRADRVKHLLVRQQRPDLDIRFVFDDPNKKIRKGSKTTYADICNGKGRGPFKNVKWKYSKKEIPNKWLEE